MLLFFTILTTPPENDSQLETRQTVLLGPSLRGQCFLNLSMFSLKEVAEIQRHLH